jgi:hypothetical protein
LFNLARFRQAPPVEAEVVDGGFPVVRGLDIGTSAQSGSLVRHLAPLLRRVAGAEIVTEAKRLGKR